MRIMKILLIHLGRRMIREDSAEDNGLQIRDGVLNPEQKTETWYQFRDYRSENTQVLRMLEMAKRISLTDYRVLIQERKFWLRRSITIPVDAEMHLSR